MDNIMLAEIDRGIEALRLAEDEDDICDVIEVLRRFLPEVQLLKQAYLQLKEESNAPK